VAPESVAEAKPAGLVLYADSQNCAKIRSGASRAVVSVLEKGRLRQYAQSAGAGSAWLSVSARGQSHKFQVSVDGRSWVDAGPTIDGRFLSPESIRLQPGRKSFTGVRIGVFDESAPGDPTRFLSFVYEALNR